MRDCALHIHRKGEGLLMAKKKGKKKDKKKKGKKKK